MSIESSAMVPIPATGGRRQLAGCLDLVLLLMVLFALLVALALPQVLWPSDETARMLATGIERHPYLSLLAVVLVYRAGIAWLSRGISLGQWVVGIGIVRRGTGLPVTRLRAAGRAVAAVLVGVPMAAINALLPARFAHEQTLHDQWCDTQVILRQPHGQAKRLWRVAAIAVVVLAVTCYGALFVVYRAWLAVANPV